MGGDHKCPVCQATFTRPQHVARHMRSHTGDRPYKCLYCGDQFARSDLLSRHCNKCHANEKPLPATGSRRRGSASASRATTSKQACDQCVQSSLPCDGSNPCAKCVQRKCRCTYVKFHRQTAPMGPGHNTRPATMGAAGAIPPVGGGLPPHPDSHLPMYPHPDELLLGPQPSVVPPTADNSYSQSYAFPPIYPQHSADPATLSLVDNAVAAKYRTQSDLYRRTSVPMSTAPGAGLIPGLYTDPRQQPNWMAWGQENDSSFTSSTNNNPEGIHDKDLHPYMGTQGVLLSSTGDSAFPHPSAYIDRRDRRASTDYASEGSSATSHSVSSSAASSSVHLPMDGMAIHQHYPPDQHSFTTAPPADRAYANRGQVGGFSSAFGLMCLDDPNAMASMSTDGAFFSNDALGVLTDDPNQTPVPLLPESKVQRQTPSKEAEIRELREFWKQYIRTPLSGPGPICSGNDASSPHTQRHHPSSPSAYRRPRVASMPSTKSPLSVDPERHHPQHRDDGNVTSSLRTTLTDDLKSYEAAVMARKAPTTLNLGPRARKKAGGPNSSQGGSPQVPSIQEEHKVINLNYSPTSSRPPSAMGIPSLPSLANWSGKLLPVHLAYGQDQMSTSSPPSRESSLSLDEAAGSGGSDREGLRPSFKRLPSQTLGPLNTKRAQLSNDEAGLPRPGSSSSSGIPVPVYGNGTSDDGGCMDIDGGKIHPRPSTSVPDRLTVGLTGNMFVEHGRQLQHAFHHPDRPVVNIADRHRRMSAPTMTAPSIPAFTFVAPPGPGSGANA